MSINEVNLNIELAPWCHNVFYPSFFANEFRYFIIYGGRGSGKSEAVAQLILILSLRERCKILCARHIQHSIAESSKSRIEEWIHKLNLQDSFTITKVDITNKHTQTKIIFKGLSNVTKENITSINDIKYLWIEEAHNITPEVWLRTDPSIRAVGSKIIATFNPHDANDCLYDTFITKKHPGSFVLRVNYNDNPWFSQTPLYQMRLDFKATYPLAIYQHVWEGELMEYNENPVIFTDRFHKYTETPKVSRVLISIDTAYTTKESSDYTAMLAFTSDKTLDSENFYLLDIMRGKWDFTELITHVSTFHSVIQKKFKVNPVVLIENKSAGISLIQLLKRETKFNIQLATPTKDKFTRVQEVLDILHGSFFIPNEHPALTEYLLELTNFTSDGTHLHDDQVDATTQALSYLRSKGNYTPSSFLKSLQYI